MPEKSLLGITEFLKIGLLTFARAFCSRKTRFSRRQIR